MTLPEYYIWITYGMIALLWIVCRVSVWFGESEKDEKDEVVELTKGDQAYLDELLEFKIENKN